MSDGDGQKVIGVVVCDFERAAIGTRSRLTDVIGGKRVLTHVIERLLAVEGIGEIALLAKPEEMERARSFATDLRVHVQELISRSAGISARVRAGRQWNLTAWRGGAGQFTAFDEEYHPAGIAFACAQLKADHVLVVHSHGIFLDPPMTGALVRHHVFKNHEMKMTYTPSSPGLCGMVLRADVVMEMGQKHVLPWQLLAYDPANPTFDTLIREACMQVDPALSKIPNRFCVDTDRSWQSAEELLGRGPFGSVAEMALAAARVVAPGVRDLEHVHRFPRELEIELTGKRLTKPPGTVPALLRESRGVLDAAHWQRWFELQIARSANVRSTGFSLPESQPEGCTPNNISSIFPDDLLLTFAGDGDPLLYPDLLNVLHAARDANVMAICVQTDLASESIDPLIDAIKRNLIDVLSVTTYGHTAAVYNAVSQSNLHAVVMKNLTRLAPIITENNGIPLVVPRLLKVRETIPEMEPFFDTWLQQAGWAVIDGPTDRAGQVAFAGVVDMAPPKRKACRRLWERMLIRANGAAVACDQDMNDRLTLGHIESHTLAQMWMSTAFSTLRRQHADGSWQQIDPCKTCREWHRA